jgi:hypothetical protein
MRLEGDVLINRQNDAVPATNRAGEGRVGDWQFELWLVGYLD